MTEIKLIKRYPQSRTEDIVDAYMRGWNDALDAVQNGKFIINDDRKTEPQTDGYMTAEQAEDYRKMLDKAEHKVYGNIEDEPQTITIEGKMSLNEWRKICPENPQFKDGPQTDCSWK